MPHQKTSPAPQRQGPHPAPAPTPPTAAAAPSTHHRCCSGRVHPPQLRVCANPESPEETHQDSPPPCSWLDASQKTAQEASGPPQAPGPIRDSTEMGSLQPRHTKSCSPESHLRGTAQYLRPLFAQTVAPAPGKHGGGRGAKVHQGECRGGSAQGRRRASSLELPRVLLAPADKDEEGHSPAGSACARRQGASRGALGWLSAHLALSPRDSLDQPGCLPGAAALSVEHGAPGSEGSKLPEWMEQGEGSPGTLRVRRSRTLPNWVRSLWGSSEGSSPGSFQGRDLVEAKSAPDIPQAHTFRAPRATWATVELDVLGTGTPEAKGVARTKISCADPVNGPESKGKALLALERCALGAPGDGAPELPASPEVCECVEPGSPPGDQGLYWRGGHEGESAGSRGSGRASGAPVVANSSSHRATQGAGLGSNPFRAPLPHPAGPERPESAPDDSALEMPWRPHALVLHEIAERRKICPRDRELEMPWPPSRGRPRLRRRSYSVDASLEGSSTCMHCLHSKCALHTLSGPAALAPAADSGLQVRQQEEPAGPSQGTARRRTLGAPGEPREMWDEGRDRAWDFDDEAVLAWPWTTAPDAGARSGPAQCAAATGVTGAAGGSPQATQRPSAGPRGGDTEPDSTALAPSVLNAAPAPPLGVTYSDSHRNAGARDADVCVPEPPCPAASGGARGGHVTGSTGSEAEPAPQGLRPRPLSPIGPGSRVQGCSSNPDPSGASQTQKQAPISAQAASQGARDGPAEEEGTAEGEGQRGRHQHGGGVKERGEGLRHQQRGTLAAQTGTAAREGARAKPVIKARSLGSRAQGDLGGPGFADLQVYQGLSGTLTPRAVPHTVSLDTGVTGTDSYGPGWYHGAVSSPDVSLLWEPYSGEAAPGDAWHPGLYFPSWAVHCAPDSCSRGSGGQAGMPQARLEWAQHPAPQAWETDAGAKPALPLQSSESFQGHCCRSLEDLPVPPWGASPPGPRHPGAPRVSPTSSLRPVRAAGSASFPGPVAWAGCHCTGAAPGETADPTLSSLRGNHNWQAHGAARGGTQQKAAEDSSGGPARVAGRVPTASSSSQRKAAQIIPTDLEVERVCKGLEQGSPCVARVRKGGTLGPGHSGPSGACLRQPDGAPVVHSHWSSCSQGRGSPSSTHDPCCYTDRDTLVRPRSGQAAGARRPLKIDIPPDPAALGTPTGRPAPRYADSVDLRTAPHGAAVTGRPAGSLSSTKNPSSRGILSSTRVLSSAGNLSPGRAGSSNRGMRRFTSSPPHCAGSAGDCKGLWTPASCGAASRERRVQWADGWEQRGPRRSLTLSHESWSHAGLEASFPPLASEQGCKGTGCTGLREQGCGISKGGEVQRGAGAARPGTESGEGAAAGAHGAAGWRRPGYIPGGLSGPPNSRDPGYPEVLPLARSQEKRRTDRGRIWATEVLAHMECG